MLVKGPGAPWLSVWGPGGPWLLVRDPSTFVILLLISVVCAISEKQTATKHR